MLKINTFSSNEDVYVSESFGNYLKGDIIPAGKLEKNKAVQLWLSGKIKNVGQKQYTRQELESFPFKELKDIGENFGVTDRSKSKLITEILAAQ